MKLLSFMAIAVSIDLFGCQTAKDNHTKSGLDPEKFNTIVEEKNDGVEYQLHQNDYGHCLHCGEKGFHHSVWDAEQFNDSTLCRHYNRPMAMPASPAILMSTLSIPSPPTTPSTLITMQQQMLPSSSTSPTTHISTSAESLQATSSTKYIRAFANIVSP